MSRTLYLEPSCPFSWVTARWLALACDAACESVHIRPLSLHLANAGRDDVPAEFAARQLAGLGVLRAMECARELAGERGASTLYVEAGRRFHDQDDHRFERLPEAVRAAGLPERVAAAAHDPRWDVQLQSVLDALVLCMGESVSSPMLELDADGPLLKGPILRAVPDRDGAVRLLEGLQSLSGVPELSQVSRPMPPVATS